MDPWRISLWLVQLVLAGVFADDGLAKATQPIGALAESFLGSGQVAEGLVRAIGAGELIAAVGLVLPTATRILPVLTPLAALWLALLMWTAFVFHAMCGEWQLLSVNVVLGVLAAGTAVWRRCTSTQPSAYLDALTGPARQRALMALALVHALAALAASATKPDTANQGHPSCSRTRNASASCSIP